MWYLKDVHLPRMKYQSPIGVLDQWDTYCHVCVAANTPIREVLSKLV